MFVGVIVGSMIYKVIILLFFKVLNSFDGFKVIVLWIEMCDGRYLVYKEMGVKRERVSYYIIYVYGYGGFCFLSVLIFMVSIFV